jgi:RNA polymerase sigma factor (sigma-70 family)
MTEADWLAERFAAHRDHLRAVAYRMLGSVAEADDAVQEAWFRLARTDIDAVRDLGAWLTTVVARLCLDQLRARSARREAVLETSIPDPIISGIDAVDPEQSALLADSLGLAMLIVLDRLAPAERVAFVLHDVFGLPFAEIAPLIERSVPATRQLASRARRRVRGADPERAASLAVTDSRGQQETVIAAFLAAARDGDLERLIRVLDPDVVVRADAGSIGAPAGRSQLIRGADAVARSALAFRRLAGGAREALVNGLPGFVVFDGDRPYAVLAFTQHGGRVVELDILLDPVRLATLDLSAIAR